MAGAVALTLVLVGWLSANQVRLAFLVARARTALDERRFDDARQLLERAEQVNADSAEVQYRLAIARRRAGYFAEVEAPLKRALELGWPGDDIKRQRALTAFQTCDYAASEPFLSKLVAGGAPNDVALEIYEALVKGYMAGYRVNDAMVCLKHWIDWRPDDPMPYDLRATLWNTLSDKKRELADLTELLKRDPDNLDGHFRYADCLMHFNKPEQAREHFAWCYQRKRQSLLYRFSLANCELRAGHSKDARALLEDALSLDADPHVRAYGLMILGQADLEEGKYPTAVDYLTKAVELDPKMAQAHYSLGRALSRVGKKDEADRSFKRSSELSDDFERLDDLAREIIHEPDNDALRVEAAELLIKREAWKDALSVLLSVLQRDPQNIAAHRLAAELHERQGNREMAEKHRFAAAHPETVRHKSVMGNELSIADP